MHHRNVRNERGFALDEFMVVLAMVVLVFVGGFYVILTKTIIMGNQWVTEEGALKCVQLVEPKAKKVVKLERNAWSPTVVTVDDAGGKRLVFDLDADVFFNADCVETDSGLSL